jgi:predicted component of type VI protein secretion system
VGATGDCRPDGDPKANHASSGIRGIALAPAVSADGVPELRGLHPGECQAGEPDQHGLRHYYATVLIHAGASVKTVQLALGHSTPTVTLNTYLHEWPDVIDRTRLLVDGALGRHETAATRAVSPA